MKKLLSIILAAAMLMSLIPSVFAVEGEAEPAASYVFDFDAESAGGIEGYTYTDTRNWSYFAMSEGLQEIYDTTESKYTVAGIGGAGLQMRLTSANYETVEGPQWLALKIKIPTDGIYEVSYTAVTKKGYCSDGFLNILAGNHKKEDLTYDICKSNSFASKISYATTSTDTADSTVTATGVLTAEEDGQEFIFVIGNNDEATGYMVQRNLTLTRISETVTLDEDVINLNIGDTQTVTASLASGKKLLSCSSVEYSVADSSVAEVVNGVVTAKKSGSTTLTAKIGDAEKTIPLIVGYKYDFTPGEYAGAPTRLQGIKEDRYASYVTGRNWKYENMSDGMHERYKTEAEKDAPKYYQVLGFNTTGIQFNSQTDKEDWVAFRIKVPEKGLYYANCVIYQKNSSSYCTKGYMSMLAPDAPSGDFTIDRATLQQFVIASNATFQTSGDPVNTVVATKKLIAANEDGAEFTFMVGNGDDNGYIIIDSLTLVKADDEIKLDKLEINLLEGKTETVTAALENHTAFIGGSKPSYLIPEADSAVATVSEKGVVTAVGEGETTLTATIGDKTATIPVTVTAPDEDELFTEEFGEGTYETDSTPAFAAPEEGVATTTVNTYTAVIGGTNSTATLHTVNLGEEFSITADEKDSDGNVFRYWALGLSENKKVLTRERTLKFMPTVETKHVIAVYEPENGATVTGESFYNANGQLLTGVKITEGKMPLLPSMTGYGTASAWVQYGTGTEFAEGADAPTENKMFVAKYAEPTVTYAINVVDGTGEGNYTYGQKVTCTATIPEGKIFKCWTKTPVGGTAKIISLDKEYTFSAWEACTITAVFADKEPVFTGNKFSIILSTMGVVDNHTAYMAEFVGLGDAVEKGIMFGTKRVAMTTDAAQFTAVNDINGVVDANVKGYAILPDGTVIYDK